MLVEKYTSIEIQKLDIADDTTLYYPDLLSSEPVEAAGDNPVDIGAVLDQCCLKPSQVLGVNHAKSQPYRGHLFLVFIVPLPLPRSFCSGALMGAVPGTSHLEFQKYWRLKQAEAAQNLHIMGQRWTQVQVGTLRVAPF